MTEHQKGIATLILKKDVLQNTVHIPLFVLEV
jgi:hypothetical protein